MTSVGDRAAKWMRYIARALTVIWAGLLTVILVVFGAMDRLSGVIPSRTWEDVIGLLVYALIVLLVWAGAGIPWRWERAGGVLLVVEGFLALMGQAIMIGPAELARGVVPRGFTSASEVLLLITLPALPPLVASILFLASWWLSRRAGIPENNS